MLNKLTNSFSLNIYYICAKNQIKPKGTNHNNVYKVSKNK